MNQRAIIYNANRKQCSKEISRINANTRQHLYSFTSIPQAPPTSIYTEPNEKKMRVATSRGAPSLCATAPRESLRRGARSSCLHVHASLVRVARCSDPRLSNHATHPRLCPQLNTPLALLSVRRFATGAPFSAPPPFELRPELPRRGRAISLSLHPAPFGGRGS